MTLTTHGAGLKWILAYMLIKVLWTLAILYHCPEVNKVEITDSLLMVPFLFSKHESSILINAGEGESRSWWRSCTSDGRGGPGPCENIKYKINHAQFNLTYMHQYQKYGFHLSIHFH